jgi:hypothetical protein
MRLGSSKKSLKGQKADQGNPFCKCRLCVAHPLWMKALMAIGKTILGLLVAGTVIVGLVGLAWLLLSLCSHTPTVWNAIAALMVALGVSSMIVGSYLIGSEIWRRIKL